MRGVLAILGLIACVTAYQYSYPETQYGNHYQNEIPSTYNYFRGPYSRQYYQRYPSQMKYGQYQRDPDDEFGNKFHYNSEEEHQVPLNAYMGIYKSYKDGMFNKHFGTIQNYLKKHVINSNEQTMESQDETREREPVRHVNAALASKQQDVLHLLKYINNPMYDTEYQNMVNEFDIAKYAQEYKTEAYEAFMHQWQNKLFLPKGHIFSALNDVHVKQVKVLYELFYTAKDYATFHKTAVWARHYINEGMFLYTYTTAIALRQDTQGLFLPPIYEIYPHYFFNSEVMQKAYQYKMAHFGGKYTENTGIYTIPSNYSGFYLNVHPEQSLSYYLEDVGINAFYYYSNLFFPYWLSSKESSFNDKRGEVFYYVLQQLLARYNLERLSHGMGQVESLDWEVPFEPSYYPSLTYANGLAFPERPNFANLREYIHQYGKRSCSVTKTLPYSQRIKDAIDLGYVHTADGKTVNLYTSEGLTTLANMIEGNADSPNYRYYGSYINAARHILGFSKQPVDDYLLAPSALEHYETAHRDPAFFKLAKDIVALFQTYSENLPTYTKKDLYFPGVKVEKFEIDPLITFFDKFYADITNGLFVNPEEYKADTNFKVQVEQYRLNHKSFNYKVYVNSDKVTKAMIKVFIGPKHDEHGRVVSFSDTRMNFVELDAFVYTLKAGENVINRNSRNSVWYGRDKTSFLDIYRNVMSNTQEDIFHVDDFMLGFPQRMMLPRGSEGGMAYKLYVIVYPYVHNGEHTSNNHQTKYNDDAIFSTEQIQDEQVYDKMTQYKLVRMDSVFIGYPFDRPAEFEQVYYVPNAYTKDVKIYHKVLKTEDVQTPEIMRDEPTFFM